MQIIHEAVRLTTQIERTTCFTLSIINIEKNGGFLCLFLYTKKEIKKMRQENDRWICHVLGEVVWL